MNKHGECKAFTEAHIFFYNSFQKSIARNRVAVQHLLLVDNVYYFSVQTSLSPAAGFCYLE
jgi:hypothetical protein